MVAYLPPRPQPARRTNYAPTGDTAERLELLRLRSSDDPTARAIALATSQLLRRIDRLLKMLRVAA